MNFNTPMRGTHGILKTVKENKVAIRNLYIWLLVANLFIGILFYLRNKHILSFIKWSLVEILFLGLLHINIKPVIIEEKENIYKVISCRSIEESGLPSALVDSLIITTFAKGISIFNFPMLPIITFCFILIIFVYECIYKTYKQIVQKQK